MLKKLFLAMIMILFVTVMYSYENVYAGNDEGSPIRNFQITGGFGNGETELIVTFDSHRTITGTADEGTIVSIQVFHEIYEELIEIISYENIVGPSRVFSQDITLDVADNIILVIIMEEDENEELVTQVVAGSIVIRRMSPDIKHEIEGRGIALPGRRII